MSEVRALDRRPEPDLDAWLALVERLVGVESPTGYAPGIHEVQEVVAVELERRGAEVERIEPEPGYLHLIGSWGGAGARPPDIPAAGTSSDRDDARDILLVLVHVDTVHPLGTLARFPFELREEGGGARVYGPGAYDMKGGTAAFFGALDLLRRMGKRPPPGLVLLATSDEETGAHHSSGLIERWASRARTTLVLEPCLPGGRAKTRRKGLGTYRLDVRGRPAHSGVEPGAGASAIHELGRLVTRIGELEDPETDTTVNVGRIGGGTARNVVAEQAWAELEVRFWTRAEADRTDRALRELEPDDPRCILTLSGGVNRYALERTPANANLFELARAEARSLGFALEEGSTGGVSDGNFAAAVGSPTLDGLGPDGGGAHSREEHVLLDRVPRCISLLAALLEKA